MAKKIQCIVTGKTYTFAEDYYNKKVEEYVDEDNLQKYFIVRKAKGYLERGYSVQEVRNILNVECSDLPEPDSQPIRDLIQFHKIKNNETTKKVANTLNFATHKSDADVVEFINNIRTYEIFDSSTN